MLTRSYLLPRFPAAKAALDTAFSVFDPTTFNPATGKRQPFPGNIIPPDLISPHARTAPCLLSVRLGLRTENLMGNPRTTDNYDQFGGRVDAAGDLLPAVHDDTVALRNYLDGRHAPVSLRHSRWLGIVVTPARDAYALQESIKVTQRSHSPPRGTIPTSPSSLPRRFREAIR